MKTATLTLHDTDNCGSSLQAFALQHFLIKNNIENIIVDYVPEYTQNNGNPLKHILRYLLFFNSSRRKRAKFLEFKRTHLITTQKKYKTFVELQNEKFDIDCFIVGSDQLWNNMYGCGNDPAFYLDFTIKKKIAYAVSLGRECIPNDNKNLVKKYARGYSWVSFREKSSVNQLKDYFDCNVDYVCDPVLLNSIDEYEVIKGKRIIDDPYILVYIAQSINRDDLNRTISEAKNSFTGKVVFIGAYRNKCNCDVHLRDASPDEFLSLIDNAELVISNSFHATVFSIMYKKQFVTIIPPENGERINELLKVSNLEEQKSGNSKYKLITDEQYTEAHEKLKLLTGYSQNLLLENIRR